MTRFGWVVSQTRVCDTGPQFTPFSLSRCGSQRYSAILPVGGRAMPETYGYVRTSRPRVSELAGSDPETQRQQLLAAGVALSHIYQDVGVSGTSGTNSRRGWHSLESRLAQATPWLWCPSTGRRWSISRARMRNHITDEEGPGHVPGPKPRARACRNRWCGGY